MPLAVALVGRFPPLRHCRTSFPRRAESTSVAGRIEMDMAPEDLYCHGTLKSEIAAVLQQQVKSAD